MTQITDHAALASQWAMEAEADAQAADIDGEALNLAYQMAMLHSQVANSIALTAQAAAAGQFPGLIHEQTERFAPAPPAPTP